MIIETKHIWFYLNTGLINLRSLTQYFENIFDKQKIGFSAANSTCTRSNTRSPTFRSRRRKYNFEIRKKAQTKKERVGLRKNFAHTIQGKAHKNLIFVLGLQAATFIHIQIFDNSRAVKKFLIYLEEVIPMRISTQSFRRFF